MKRNYPACDWEILEDDDTVGYMDIRHGSPTLSWVNTNKINLSGHNSWSELTCIIIFDPGQNLFPKAKEKINLLIIPDSNMLKTSET